MFPSRLLLAALVMSLPGPAVLAQATPQQTTDKSCVDVKIGMEQYYDCVNRRLQEETHTHPFTSRDAPYSAASPTPAVGGFNQTATP